MTTSTIQNNQDDKGGLDVLGILRQHQRLIVRATLVVTAIVGLLGAWFFIMQPVRSVASQLFRPTFKGAENGEYPNESKFGPSDIVSSAVLNQVFDKNRIQDYCARDPFRSGFLVSQNSPDYASLAAEYQGRLGEARITSAERDRLLQEYKDKQRALPLEYQIAFLRQPECAKLSTLMMTKVVTDALSTWADDAERRRGVLNIDVQVLTPNAFNVAASGSDSLLIRADLIRNVLQRLKVNIDKVSSLPGANLIRLGENRTTLLEVRVGVDGLMQSKLDPLVVVAGQGLGRDSLAWANESLATALREQKALEGKANAYLDALRIYSGTASPATTRADSRQTAQGSGEIQAAPQFDIAFIDRILGLSGPNTLFRQELTKQMVQTNVLAAAQQSNVSHYQRLSEQLRQPGSSGVTPKEMADRLQAVVDEAKALTKQFNDLYDEFSRVSLGSGSALYQLDGPVLTRQDRALSLRGYLTTVFGAFFSMLLLMAVGCFLWSAFIRPSTATS